MAKNEMSAAEQYRLERKERLAKAAKKNQKKHTSVKMSKTTKKVIAVVLVIALVAGIAAGVVSNSGVLERGKVAFTIAPSDAEVKDAIVTLDASEEITKAEYSYYYVTMFSNYFNTAYQYDYYYGAGAGAAYTGYDYSVSPDTQPCSIADVEGVENPMWTDYFRFAALNSIKYVAACCAYAKANGIELDEADYAEVEEVITSLEEQAKNSNYSTAAYLRYVYGKSMTIDAFRSIAEKQIIATKVQTTLTEGYKNSYTDEEALAEFNKDLTAYGAVVMRTYTINAEKVEVPAEKEGEEATTKVTEETMAAAKATAQSFISKVTDGESFKAAAVEFEKAAGSKEYEKFATDESATLMDEVTYDDVSYYETDADFLKWAFNKDTAANSTYLVEHKDSGYAVYMMIEPVHTPKDKPTYDVRHILVEFPEEKEGEEASTEEAKDSDVELLDASEYEGVTIDIDVDLEKTKDIELYGLAQEILVDYLKGDRSEDHFAELAIEHSTDGNAADGGIYEDVPYGQMVPEFEGWAVAEGREYGDVGIVETTYGYHVMYYIGSGVIKWQDGVKDDMAAAEFNEFAEKIDSIETIELTDMDETVLGEVKDFVVSFAKTQIANIKANSMNG